MLLNKINYIQKYFSIQLEMTLAAPTEFSSESWLVLNLQCTIIN